MISLSVFPPQLRGTQTLDWETCPTLTLQLSSGHLHAGARGYQFKDGAVGLQIGVNALQRHLKFERGLRVLETAYTSPVLVVKLHQ